VVGGSNAAGRGWIRGDSQVTLDGRQIIIFASDLHLAEGTHHSPDEQDTSIAFARFVGDLTGQLGLAHSGIRLVVLGDMLDLTRLDARVRPGMAVAASIERLESIARAHAALFAALGRFVSAGGDLDIVVGNHDLELAHPAVQARFIDRLGVPALGSGAASVTFHRWFLYLPGLAYAEHGHRYHDINAVPVPDGRDVPGVHRPRAVPLAAFLESFLRVVRASVPGRTVAHDLGTLTASLLARGTQHGSNRLAPELRDDGSRFRDAADAGLDVVTLSQIDALSARLGGKTALRIGRTILGPPLRLVLPYGATASLLAYVFRGRSLTGPAAAVAVAAGLATLVRSRRRLWPPPRSTAYALQAAKDLRRALEHAGAEVPFYILGHTHVPAVVELDGPGKRVVYLNTGSWSAPDWHGRGRPFVQLTRSETSDPDAVLLWWAPENSADHPPGRLGVDGSTPI
jgi:UDP-2,3-diacylglucosamine pyrophosphatase LpxH